MVKKHAHDQYQCCLFLPESQREHVFALMAFHVELARIPGSVSEEMLGHIRFAWWREALDEVFAGGTVRKHPVVEALADVVRDVNIPRSTLDAMIEAHQHWFVISDSLTQQEWENTLTAMWHAVLVAINSLQPALFHAKSTEILAKKYALVHYIRHLPQTLRSNDKRLPPLLRKNHTGEKPADDEIPSKQAVINAVRQMSESLESLARHKEDAKKHAGVSRYNRLWLVLCGHYSRRLKQVDYDVFNMRIETGKLMLLLRMTLCMTFTKH